MKTLLFALVISLTLAGPISGQDNAAVPQRSPEQEAVKQTERLQQELNLTPDQAKHIYEINLRYARERQISNKRAEALVRMKNKNSEIQQVLNHEQNEKLQTKRYERTSIQMQNLNRNISTGSSGFRSSQDFHNGPANNNNRPVNPNFQNRTQPNQSIRRGSAPGSAPNLRSTQRQNNPTTTRSSSTPARKAETPVITNRK
jgi:hypothetical protein